MRTTTFLILLALPVLACAQGEIRGKVTSQLTGQPVLFANVYTRVNGSIIGTTTDDNGRYNLKVVKPGFYDVSFSSAEYDSVRMNGVRVTNDNITSLDVQMPVRTLGVFTKVEYDWEVPLIEHEGGSKMKVLAADIKHNPNRQDPMTMIATLGGGGIYKKDDGRENELYFRGARANASQYIVDGVKTRDGRLGIPSSAIGEITVYTGGVPAKYGDFTGGVVVIETKSYFEILNQKQKEEKKKQREAEQESEL